MQFVERLIASFEPDSASQAAGPRVSITRRDDVKTGNTAMVSGDEALARVRARIRELLPPLSAKVSTNTSGTTCVVSRRGVEISRVHALSTSRPSADRDTEGPSPSHPSSLTRSPRRPPARYWCPTESASRSQPREPQHQRVGIREGKTAVGRLPSIRDWRLYADHTLAPLRRSVTPGT